MLTKVVTGLNADASKLTVELHEQLNPFVAASLIDAEVDQVDVFADDGGVVYITASFGGPDVVAKREELEKDDSKDKDGKPVEGGKTPKQKLEDAFAEAKKKRDDKKAAEAAKVAKKPAPVLPTETTASVLSPAGASTKSVPVPEEEKDNGKQPVGAGARTAPPPAKESAKEAPKHGR